MFVDTNYGVYGSNGGCCDFNGSDDNNYVVASPTSGSSGKTSKSSKGSKGR